MLFLQFCQLGCNKILALQRFCFFYSILKFPLYTIRCSRNERRNQGAGYGPNTIHCWSLESGEQERTLEIFLRLLINTVQRSLISMFSLGVLKKIFINLFLQVSTCPLYREFSLSRATLSAVRCRLDIFHSNILAIQEFLIPA